MSNRDDVVGLFLKLFQYTLQKDARLADIAKSIVKMSRILLRIFRIKSLKYEYGS